jgi:hypothetical protein
VRAEVERWRAPPKLVAAGIVGLGRAGRGGLAGGVEVDDVDPRRGRLGAVKVTSTSLRWQPGGVAPVGEALAGGGLSPAVAG